MLFRSPNSGATRWPSGLGMWPAVGLLLLWSWLEVIYALPSSPQRIGLAVVAWTVVNIVGMLGFGRDSWQRHADVFAIYFDQLGRIAPLQLKHSKELIKPQDHEPQPPQGSNPGRVGFVIAMLASVLFDGLHGSPAWLIFQETGQRWLPLNWDVNGYWIGALGLICVWLVLGLAYVAACWITAR